jgi:hypothetical protein
MKRSVVVASMLAGGIAAAQTDAVIARIEKQIPPGWTLLATDAEVVIRHDRPCYVKGRAEGPLITLELRYRLEPKWSAQQLADARAKNDKLDAELRAARKKVAALADAHARDAETAKLDAQERLRRVRLPRCTLGVVSLFDSDDTYAQLALDLDPPEAKTEARRVIAVVDQECPTSK